MFTTAQKLSNWNWCGYKKYKTATTPSDRNRSQFQLPIIEEKDIVKEASATAYITEIESRYRTMQKLNGEMDLLSSIRNVRYCNLEDEHDHGVDKLLLNSKFSSTGYFSQL